MGRPVPILTAFLLYALCFAQPCAAGEERLKVEGPTELQEFLATYRCAVAERLAIIHANRDREMDRFLIIALKFVPENYVQCLFLDGDRRMLCEASSGFYAQLPGENQHYRVSAEGLAALARLGFSTDGNEGNFQRIVAFSGDPDLESVATLILSTLYEVYGVRLGSQLEWKSPLAHIDRYNSVCVPIG